MPRKAATKTTKKTKKIVDITAHKTAPILSPRTTVVVNQTADIASMPAKRQPSDVKDAPLIGRHGTVPLTAPLLDPAAVASTPTATTKKKPVIDTSDLPAAPSIDELKARRSHQLTRQMATPAAPEKPEKNEIEPAAPPSHKALVLKPLGDTPPVDQATPAEQPTKKLEPATPKTPAPKKSEPPVKEPEKSVSQLIESKQYFLPINAVEKRKTKRFVIAGLLLSIILAAAWMNIALDASLISIPGIQPITDFF